MTPQVNLTVRDEFGGTREVAVESKRFTIGRTDENDLAIENTSLSRRHAVIESFDGQVQITDCGSQNGTEVNGAVISPAAFLQDGDLITLAGVCDIDVRISSATVSVTPKSASASPVVRQRASSLTPSAARLDKAKAPSQKKTSFFSTPLGQGAAIGTGLIVILISVGLLLVVLKYAGSNRNINQRQSNQRNLGTPEISNVSQPSPSTEGQTDGTENIGNGKGTDAGIDQIESSASGVIRRLSSDDKTYGFSEKALQDIARKVNQFRTSSSLASNLTSLQRSGSSLSSLARQEGMEPGLLIFVVLANQEVSHSSTEPRVLAQGAIADLLALRATFGTNDADSSLLVLAAYKMGRGEKRSHPLLATIRKLVRNPLTQRNVWYLNDRGGLEPQAYDFVVSVLALGVIAQNPQQFGIAASPLVF